ncbi:MAG: 50S ribosomal protein L32 [Candidatus Gracilibacteria bacterium]|nr:50S ribosomal protein L32 [Candidatus Gracilibacteria bacterium]
MTISPQQQLSKVRGKKRYSAWLKLNAKRLKDLVSLQYNEAGEATALSHFASPITGEYKGRKVISIRTGKGKTPTKIRA